MTRQAALSKLTDRLNKLWDVLEKDPDHPKFAERERRFRQLLVEYERISDGGDFAGREGTQSASTT